MKLREQCALAHCSLNFMRVDAAEAKMFTGCRCTRWDHFESFVFFFHGFSSGVLQWFLKYDSLVCFVSDCATVVFF